MGVGDDPLNGSGLGDEFKQARLPVSLDVRLLLLPSSSLALTRSLTIPLFSPTLYLSLIVIRSLLCA